MESNATRPKLMETHLLQNPGDTLEFGKLKRLDQNMANILRVHAARHGLRVGVRCWPSVRDCQRLVMTLKERIQ